MGMGAALKLKEILTNCETILGIELLASAQGLDFLAPKQTGLLARRAYRLLRRKVSALTEDRSLHADIGEALHLVHSGRIASILASSHP